LHQGLVIPSSVSIARLDISEKVLVSRHRALDALPGGGGARRATQTAQNVKTDQRPMLSKAPSRSAQNVISANITLSKIDLAFAWVAQKAFFKTQQARATARNVTLDIMGPQSTRHTARRANSARTTALPQKKHRARTMRPISTVSAKHGTAFIEENARSIIIPFPRTSPTEATMWINRTTRAAPAWNAPTTQTVAQLTVNGVAYPWCKSSRSAVHGECTGTIQFS
jgi:hypothetical protein